MSEFIKDGLARNYIAGKWAEGENGNKIAVDDPGNEGHIADCALAGERDLALALDAGRASFERGDLAQMKPANRAN